MFKDVVFDDLYEVIMWVVWGDILLLLVSIDFVCVCYCFYDEVLFSDIFGEKEVVILCLLVGGYLNKEIVCSLFLVEGMVKNYVFIILDKLGMCDCICVVFKVIMLWVI